MDTKNNTARFDSAISALPGNLQAILSPVPASAKQTAQEIRLRVGSPAALTCPGQVWFVGNGGELQNLPRQGCLITKRDLADALLTLCSYSVHTHQDELRRGFLSLPGGHRAGVAGAAVYTNGQLSAVRDVTSLCIRVAREIRGAAVPLVESCFRGVLTGVLIAGPPSSGKTTILRDLAYQLSSGAGGRIRRVAIVDERFEIAAVSEGVPQNRVGPSSDVLSGYPKGEGILMAVRTLSPEVILCDEIGGADDADSILDGIGCGVKIVATAHAGSLRELLRRRPLRRLLEENAFDRVVLLAGGDTPGKIRDIVEVGELLDEAAGDGPYRDFRRDDGGFHGVRLVRSGDRD